MSDIQTLAAVLSGEAGGMGLFGMQTIAVLYRVEHIPTGQALTLVSEWK